MSAGLGSDGEDSEDLGSEDLGSEVLGSEVLGSEDLGSEGLLAAASDFFPVPLASPGFAPDFFLSSDCAFSSPLALRLIARTGGPAPTDLR